MSLSQSLIGGASLRGAVRRPNSHLPQRRAAANRDGVAKRALGEGVS